MKEESRTEKSRDGNPKIARLLGYGAFSATVLSLASVLLLPHASFQYSLGWYGNAYLALLMCSPLINEALDYMDRSTLSNAWLLYSIAMVVSWLPVCSFGFSLEMPGWSHLSFNTICYMYVTGRFLRQRKWLERIGAKAMILPGVTIDEGAVVGAGSVVTRDVAPWSVVAGNPAKFIKQRVLL